MSRRSAIKGLLRKEWCLERKTVCLFLVLSLVYFVLGILVFLSMLCGNLQFIPREEPEAVPQLAAVFCYVPFLLSLFAANACNHSVYSDYESHWMRYSYTLPAGAHEIIGAKYLMGGGIFLFNLLYGMLNAAVICMLSGEAFTPERFQNLLMLWALAIVVFAVFLPLAMRLQKARTVGAIGSVLFVFAYLGLGGFVMRNAESQGDDMLQILAQAFACVRTVGAWAALPAAGIAVAVSFLVSVKLYQRREGHC